MANSSQIYTIGTAAGSQARLLKAIQHQNIKFIPTLYWSQKVKFSDYSDSDTSEALDLNATFTSNLFPANAWIRFAWIQKIVAFTGGSVSAADVILGDAGDPNGLLTSSSVFTGTGIVATPAAAEIATPTFEATYVPLLQLDTTSDNIDNLTAGELLVCIAYSPLALLPTGG